MVNKYHYPSVRRDCEYYEEHFNQKLTDPYHWFRDGKNPELLAWVKEENQYTDEYFKHLNVKERIEELKKSKAPYSYSNLLQVGNYLYATKELANSETEIVKLDLNFNEVEKLADNSYFDGKFTIFQVNMSPLDNGIGYFFALGHGADRPTVLVYDFNQKKLIKQIDGIFNSCFSNDGLEILYSDVSVYVEKQLNINYVRSYNYSTDTITTYYTDDSNSVFGGVCESKDSQYLICKMGKDYSHNTCYVVDKKTNETQTLISEAQEIEYIGCINNKHYLIDFENTPMGSIITVDVGQDIGKKKSLIIPEPNVKIQAAVIFKDQLIINYMIDVSSVVKKYQLDGKLISQIALPLNSDIQFGNQNQDTLFFDVVSFVQPFTIYTYDGNQVIKKWSEKEVNNEQIIVEQVFVPSHDNVKVPCYIIHLKDVKKDGNNPVIMYGYGGYNISMPPTYSNPFIGLDIVDWVNKGYVYVHCNIRGGNEYGSEWHVGGWKDNKKNCFYDMIAIAEYLIDNSWSKKGKIAVTGGSNGGLLVTSLITMRPDLWGCVIASVPHTDMIHFAQDDRGPMYITEYGNPSEEKMYNYFLSYSPYYNIKEVNYPPIYIQTGECDNNVPPYHGKKFAASMQYHNQSDNPILLRVLKMGSHDRGKGEVYFQTIAEMQLFIEEFLLNHD